MFLLGPVCHKLTAGLQDYCFPDVSTVVKWWQSWSDVCWMIDYHSALINNLCVSAKQWELLWTSLRSSFEAKPMSLCLRQSTVFLYFFSTQYLHSLMAPLVAQLKSLHVSFVCNCLRWPASAQPAVPGWVSSPHLASRAPFDLPLYRPVHTCPRIHIECAFNLIRWAFKHPQGMRTEQTVEEIRTFISLKDTQMWGLSSMEWQEIVFYMRKQRKS